MSTKGLGDRTAPFANCSFRECDLIGQCLSEGKCHHPIKSQPKPEPGGDATRIIETMRMFAARSANDAYRQTLVPGGTLEVWADFLSSQNVGAEKDAARLNYLEAEDQSLFRQNKPITRAAIDAAMLAKDRT